MQRPFTIVQHSAISPAICEGCNDVLPCFPHNPDDCWVLRRGKIQVVRDSVSPIRCARVKGLPAGGYLPIPLAAQGETLGMLPGVSALFRCDFFGSYNRSDGDPGTPGLGGGEAPVVGSISYGDLLVIDKTARPL